MAFRSSRAGSLPVVDEDLVDVRLHPQDSYRPTTMPRSAAYAKPGPGQSRPFSPPAPHLGPERGEVGGQSLADGTGSGNMPRVHAAAAHRKTPAAEGEVPPASSVRARPCRANSPSLLHAAEYRVPPRPGRRSLGHGRVPRPAGDCVNSCCAVPEGFPPEEVDAYVGEFTSGFRPFAPDGRPWTRSPTHGTTRHGADHREQLVPVHRLFRRQSLLVPAPHRHQP